MEPGPGSLPSAGQIDIQVGLDKYVSDIIVSTDLQDNIIYWNKAAEKFYGISAGQAVGQPFRALIKYEFSEATGEEVERSFQEKGFWDGETINVSTTGKKSYLISSIRYIRDDQEKITGIMVE